MRILYVAPHLSTGGMPQYLCKLIEKYYKSNLIEVLDVTNSGGDEFVVQKDRISKMVKVHSRVPVMELVAEFNPDVIHYQEIPEHFLHKDELVQLFSLERKHYNVVTTHSSFTDPDNIIFHPDRYVFVNEWSKQRFSHLEIDSDVWEYPIEDYSPNKLAKEKLKLNPAWKHVLHVGLFTPGKNQGEIFKVAKRMEKYKILFHFVGNQAGNFKEYWEPLMSDVPKNCVIWGERNDVDTFYQAADLFYFPSTYELAPIAIKEALSYNLPCLFRKLHTYLDSYDENKNVTYITENLSETKQHILRILKPEFNEIPGWFGYSELYDEMVEKHTDGACFVEIGAWFGKSTNYLASKIKESGKNIHLYAIDTWKGTQDEHYHLKTVDDFDGDIFQEFIENTTIYDNSILTIKDTSLNAASNFDNGSLDFVLIDAGHSYEDVKLDLETWWRKVRPGGYIGGDDYGVFSGVTDAANEFFYNQIETKGCFFKKRKPKIKVVHLLSSPEDLREVTSVQSMRSLPLYGIKYSKVVNPLYKGDVPKETCRRPDHVGTHPGQVTEGLGWVTPAHYGCYLAHTNAMKEMSDDYDYTLILEGDAFIYTGLQEFVDVLYKATFLFEKDANIHVLSFSNNVSMYSSPINNLFSKTAHNQNLAHCYMIKNSHKDWWVDKIDTLPWDVADLWLNHVFHETGKTRITTNKNYVKQAEGYSLLDLNYKPIQ